MSRSLAAAAIAALTILHPFALAAQETDAAEPEVEAEAEAEAPVVDDPEAESVVAVAPFRLELNNAATIEGGACQLTYVATNGTDVDLSQAAYQVGFFDGDGVVRSILVLEFGALPPGKTRIVLFNLPDQPCEDLSRIVVNDVAQCALTDGGTSDICISALETASRADIQFGL